MDALFIILAYLLIGGLVGGLIGRSKGRTGEGFILGAAFSILGWVMVLFLEDIRPKCSECLGPIVPYAKRCMHCGVEIYVGPTVFSCKCNTCSAVLEFDALPHDPIIICPKCGIETRLYVP